MIVHTLLPRNFRNLTPAGIQFSPHVNFISGKNGQGKTNLLEAVYWLLTLRGKRGTTGECTKNSESAFQLESDMTFADLKHRVSIGTEGRASKILVDGVAPKRRRDYLQNVLVVEFFPEDLLILIMEPALRRRFIDMASVQYYLPHEEILRRYKRVLEQRNQLLKHPGGPDPVLLESYSEPLCDAAAGITAMRLHILSMLAEKTDSIFREGIGEKYKAKLFYIPAMHGIPDKVPSGEYPDKEVLKKTYMEALAASRTIDIESGRTSSGPHRDDWGMTLDNKPVRAFASRGEVRSSMFALHLARFHILTERRGIKPVVLIDDVMSELDSVRRRRVIELLPPGQIFLTSCDPPPDLENLLTGMQSEIAHFVMESGSVNRIG